MDPGQPIQLEHILQHMSVGVAILDCSDLRLRYINSYLQSLLDQPWRSRGAIGHCLPDILPEELYKVALPLLRQVCITGKRRSWADIPFEGFLAVRGRTYWRVSIERTTNTEEQASAKQQQVEHTLLVTVEDVTELARSRLYVDAIHSISSAIVGPFALPLVLERILQAVQEMVGSTRCAILLIDSSVSNTEFHYSGFEGHRHIASQLLPEEPPTVTIAAQKGVHLRSQDWRPQLSEQLLLGQVVRERHTLVITDTSTIPEMQLPLLNDGGTPCRPGSVLCIPIFEPADNRRAEESFTTNGFKETFSQGAVLGTIEVYHRRARGFPAEEVELLEQFAQQAGLAIQNARLFLHINNLVRDANRNLRQREHIMQAIPDGVIIYDSRWRVADANDAIRTLLGWSKDVFGLHITEALECSTAIFAHDFRSMPNLIEELDRRVQERQVDELKIVGADNQHYTIRRTYAPIHDELGNIFAAVVVYHDVTEQAVARERIEAEVIFRTAELAQRNKALQLAQVAQELAGTRMKLLLERLPSGVMLISAEDMSITVINRQAAQLLQRLGLPLEPLDNLDKATEQAIGRTVDKLLRIPVVYGATGSLITFEEQPLALALNKGEANEAELHIRQADGQMIFLLASAAPLRTSDGIISSAILVLHEITKLKMLERAREDFFTTMAHELKTPLANIRAHLSALQASDLQWSAEEQYSFLATADEQVERLVGMINHFLDASRVEAGALRLELEPIILPEMLEDLEERLGALISSSRRRLKIQLPPSLPAVIADYELIMGVLTNLLSNAFRYAPEGDVVLLGVEPIYDTDNNLPSGVELRVVDRGTGMSFEQQEALFTRFSTFAAMRRPASDRPGQPAVERRKGSARWSPATGLGLYISRGIIEAHGSKLTVKSTPGEGASFAFRLAVASTVKKES
ncbi:MAG: hypothetical protein NVSMB33_09140 [Ktedonobacteraceae bacterium]